MTDLEKDKILLLAHSIGKMARELQSIEILLKEIADTPHSNLTFEKADERCKGCNHYKLTCDLFSEICRYEPKDEPKTALEAVLDRQTNEDRRKMAESVRNAIKDEPQTDCAWK